MTTGHRLAAGRRRPLVMRRLTALVVLLGAIAIPPAVLLAFIGSPLDPPAALRGTGALTQAVDDRSVLWLLAAAGWLLWLHLLLTLAAELARQTRGRTVRVPLPGLLFGANAALATHLIAGLLLTGQSTAAIGLTPAVARVPVSTVQPFLAAYRAPLAGSSPVADIATTTGAETLRSAPPALDTAAPLECRVLPPQGRDHDTLWDIAERHLGDGTRWRDIYALNHGRLMPDGQRLTRASLIRPGWTLRLPADAVALDVDRVTVTPEPSGTPGATRHPAAPPAAHADRTEPVPGAAAATPSKENPTAAPPDSQAVPHGPSARAVPDRATADRPPAAPSPEPDLGSPADDAGPAREIGVASASLLGLAAVGLLRILTRRRRIASRRRPPGVRTTPPAEPVRALEAQLRQQARVAEDTAATVQLALLLAARDAPGTRLRAVWQHTDGSYELDLAHPGADTAAPLRLPPPAPFTAGRRGWLLAADDVRFLYALTLDAVSHRERQARLAEERDRAADPFPLLVPVGSKDGSACLINLELFGLISIVGDASAAATAYQDAASQTTGSPTADGSPAESHQAIAASALVAAIVQALASAPWADLVRTYVPAALAPATTGFERLAPLDPSSVDARYAVTELNPDEQRTVQGYDSLEQARRHNCSLDIVTLSLWAGYTAAELPDHLLRAAADPRNPNCALLIGPHPTAHTWTLDRSGQLCIPGITDGLTPLALSPQHQSLILRLLEHAEDPPHAAPDAPDRTALLAQCPPLATSAPAAEPEEEAAAPGQASAVAVRDVEAQDVEASPTAAQSAALIDLTSFDTNPTPATAPDVAAPDVIAADVLAPDGTELASGRPPRDEAPFADQQARSDQEDRLDIASDQLPAEDEPPATPVLAAAPPVPTAPPAELPQHLEVNILGPLQIVGAHGDPPRRQCLELLIYLTLHRRPVPVESLWQAVFPDRPYDSHQLVNRVSELRAYARQKLPQIKRTYQVDEFTISDWQHFQALADGNPAQQLEALALVRGRPFEDLRLDWIHLEGQLAEIEASIVDLAITVGERALRNRDPETARTAALAGLRGCPWDERLYRIAMQAAAALGATHEVHQLRRQLQLVLDDELDSFDDIQPATKQLYSSLVDDEERRRRVAERRRNGG